MPVPWDPEHVFYVWFDALLNYYTALSFARDGEDLTDTFWPADFHVIGKDILKFHAVFWPAMLLAADLPLPEHLFIHGFLLMKDASGEEHKMSKSLGNVLDPFEVMDQFGTDALRYYCFREVSFGLDGSVSTTTFGERYTSELANEYGNLASAHAQHDRPLLRRRVPDVDVDPELDARLRRASPTRSRACSTAPRSPRRSTASGSACGGSTATSRRARRGSWRRTPSRPTCSTTTLRSLAEGLRVLTVLLAPYMPESTAQAARRARRRADRAGRGGVRRGRRRRRDRRAAAAVPEATVIDSHTHLDHGPAPEDELVAAAREAGVNRILTIGMDSEGCRAALAAADRFEEVFAAVGRHPNSAEGFDDAAAAELAELAQHPRCRAIGETGLDYYRDRAPREDQERAFLAQIEVAREAGKPLVIHTRAADDDTVATLATRAQGIEVVMHCFSMPDRLDECLERGWWISFAGNVTYPSRPSSPPPPSASRSTACWSRPTRRT